MHVSQVPSATEPLAQHMLWLAAAGLQLAFASHGSALQWVSGLDGSNFSSLEHPSGPASPDENRQQGNAGGTNLTRDDAGSGSSRTQQLKVDQLPFKVSNGGTLTVAGRGYAIAQTCAAGRLRRQHAGHSCSIVDQILMLQLGVHLQSGEESAASTMQPDEGLDLSLVLFPARRLLPAVCTCQIWHHPWVGITPAHFLQVLGFLDEGRVIAGGFDGEMFLFERDHDQKWACLQMLRGSCRQCALVA